MKKLMIIAAVAFTSVAAMAQTPKFAHVNFNELVQLMPEMDEARAQSEISSKEAQETYQAMVEEFQSKYQQYDQKKDTWTPAVRQSKEKELTEIQSRIEEFQAAIQSELQQQQNALLAPIYQKAEEVVSKIAKAGNYIYVFDASQVLYVDALQSDDLTKAARKELGIPEGRTLETLQQELQARAAAQQ